MKIDLHVHTTVSSPCSFIDPRYLVEAARTAGLDGVCVTEHDEIAGAEAAAELGRELGFPVFRGIEIYTEFGDMLVYGLYRDATGWRMPFEELSRLCREAGAAIIPAHPCRVSGELERKHGAGRVSSMLALVTAVETQNGGSSPEGNAAAAALAEEHGLPGIGGSDAHHVFQVGRCYTEFEQDIDSDEELVAALRSGRYRPGCGPNYR